MTYHTFALIFILLEVLTLFDLPRRMNADLKDTEIRQKKGIKLYLPVISFVIMQVIYTIWSFGGLLSEKWPIYLSLIVLSAIATAFGKFKTGQLTRKIDPVISIMILIIIYFNIL